VLVNHCNDNKSAKEVFSRLYNACDHFLSGVSLDLVGFIPQDKAIKSAVVQQVPICHLMPDAPASKAVVRLAEKIQTWNAAANLDGNIKFFWKKLLFQQ